MLVTDEGMITDSQSLRPFKLYFVTTSVPSSIWRTFASVSI